MESKNYIQSRLKDIHHSIKNISIKYEYNPLTLTHIIEVLPLDMYSDNKKYIDMEIDLTDEFFERFPNEDILFISDGSLTKISNVEFELLPELDSNNKVEICLLTEKISSLLFTGKSNEYFGNLEKISVDNLFQSNYPEEYSSELEIDEYTLAA